MKISAVIASVIIIMTLSGCGAQNAVPAESPAAPVQTENAAIGESSEENDLPEETAENAAASEPVTEEEKNSTDDEKSETEKIDTMRLLIEETEVPVTWENNASVDALKELCPLTIRMSMYGGFEQVGSIGQSIVRDDQQTSTGYGDIVLYSGNQIVVFYGSNSWAYTRLGHVNLSQQEMSELLGNGDVSITLK